jgi:uncharacterized protein YecE (DUF72 family)
MPIHIGTSGWVYKHWRRGVFYPPKLPQKNELAFYAEHFPTVELNNSFYNLPSRATFQSWRRQTPPEFFFAVKASRYLTHMKKLRDPEEPLKHFMDSARGLGDKLGPVLFQFPASWPANLDRLEDFLAALNAYRGRRWTFEFRHKSWLTPDTYRLLKSSNAALCLPVAPDVPLAVQLTADWTYIRFHRGKHGTGYSPQELSAWSRRIRDFVRDGVDTYAYFNNDAGGHAIEDAFRLRAMLDT